MTGDANDEMVEGYMDGLNPDAPDPSSNRTHSYRHGFANARADLAHRARATPPELHRMADEAIDKDRRA